MSSTERLVLVGTRVSPSERAVIGAAASLEGETIDAFLRRLVVPAASARLEQAARQIVAADPDRAA